MCKFFLPRRRLTSNASMAGGGASPLRSQPFAAKGALDPAAHRATPNVLREWGALVHSNEWELGHSYSVFDLPRRRSRRPRALDRLTLVRWRTCRISVLPNRSVRRFERKCDLESRGPQRGHRGEVRPFLTRAHRRRAVFEE
jgi:hypothetical protein